MKRACRLRSVAQQARRTLLLVAQRDFAARQSTGFDERADQENIPSCPLSPVDAAGI
jgi:hypothetical protein